MITIPIVMTPEGRQPIAPTVLRENLLATAVVLSPGLTADLPGTLIEDIASTDVGALVVLDSGVSELINSVTPYGANEFLLNQLGQIYGVQKGIGSNASVYVVFSGPPGFVIGKGFTVSDGSNQFIIQDGGIIGSGGKTSPLYAVAAQPGEFPIPDNTVTTLATSVPGGIVVTVTNPTEGIPSIAAQTVAEYRAQVIQAGLATAQGFTTFLKTQLQKISGVSPRLISVQASGPSWQMIVGGGDPYEVAYAGFMSVSNPGMLIGATLAVTGITNANPGVVTTNMAHGFTTGQTGVQLAGVVGMSGVNNTPFTITVTAPNKFSIGIDTTASGAWASGGVVTPNLRNITVSINDYPDTYQIPFITPLAQAVTISLVYNTIKPNFVAQAAVAQLGNPALVNYVNTVVAGQPINIFEMQDVFREAVKTVLEGPLITRMVFSVSINGVLTAPTAGTGIIPGDPYSYFVTDTPSVVINQG